MAEQNKIEAVKCASEAERAQRMAVQAEAEAEKQNILYKQTLEALQKALKK